MLAVAIYNLYISFVWFSDANMLPFRQLLLVYELWMTTQVQLELFIFMDHLLSNFCPNSFMVSVAFSAAFPMASWVCLLASWAASKSQGEEEEKYSGTWKNTNNY